MRHLRTLALAVLAIAANAHPSIGQDAEVRYQLERTEEGYARLDMRTGAMSLCREREGQLVCRMAAEERAAYDRDIDALTDRLTALEERVRDLEHRQPVVSLPSEEEFEQALGYMERFFRRFMGIVNEQEPDAPGPQAPADRT